MRRWFFFFIFMMVLLPIKAGAENLIRQGETLDLERCLAIALSQHPSIQAAFYTVKAGETRIGQAKSGYYPQLSGAAGVSRTDPTATTLGNASTSAGNIYDSYSSSVNLSQNLYDFGKIATQVKIQELNRDASRSDLDNTRAQVIFGVRQAYWKLLQAGKNRDVAREAVGQFQQHLDQAKGFFEIGTKPKFDVTKAEVDLSNAKLILLKTENACRLTRVNLNNAIGQPEAPDYEIVDQLSTEHVEVKLDEILRQAYERRPDLLALAVKEKSQEEAIALAKKGFYPALTGNASYGWGGNNFPLDQGWSVGAQVNIPLFSGFVTKYQVEEARATLDVLKANVKVLRQTIYLEVKQAWLNLQEASDMITATALSVRQSEENLELAQGRYKAGVGSPLEVTDGVVAAGNAKAANFAALYDYKVARASLAKATGMGER